MPAKRERRDSKPDVKKPDRKPDMKRKPDAQDEQERRVFENMASEMAELITNESKRLRSVAGIEDYAADMYDDELGRHTNRVEEIIKLDEMNVFKPVPYWEMEKGAPCFRHVWVDKPHKSRLACCDYNLGAADPRDGTFCPTPQVITTRLVEVKALIEKTPIIRADVISAFVHADEKELVYMKPPKEWCDRYKDSQGIDGKDYVWRLERSLYGRRSAGANWREHFEAVVKGYPVMVERSEYDPCLYICESEKWAMVHHVDDLTLTGPEENIERFINYLGTQLLMKRGPLEYPGSVSSFLKCKKFRLGSAMVTVPEERHIHRILELTNLEACRTVDTPAERHSGECDDNELDQDQAKRYRSAVGTAIFVSVYRVDIMFAVKECARYMSKPTVHAWGMLRRLAKYLRKTIHYGHVLQLEEVPTHIDIYVDADWGGCKKTGRSTTGVVVLIGGMSVSAICNTQPGLPALSSAESELRAMCKGAIEGIYVKHVMEELGFELPLRMWTDSTAGRAAATRLGVGRIKHLTIQDLYVQGLVQAKMLQINKVATEHNLADILTKPVPRETLERLAPGAGVADSDGLTGELVTISALNIKPVQQRLMPWKPSKLLKTVCIASVLNLVNGAEQDNDDKYNYNILGIMIFQLLFFIGAVAIGRMWTTGERVRYVEKIVEKPTIVYMDEVHNTFIKECFDKSTNTNASKEDYTRYDTLIYPGQRVYLARFGEVAHFSTKCIGLRKVTHPLTERTMCRVCTPKKQSESEQWLNSDSSRPS